MVDEYTRGNRGLSPVSWKSWSVPHFPHFARYFQRRRNALDIWKNQSFIAKLYSSKKLILLEPEPPQGARGSIKNYYHFLFDLLLPLHGLMKKADGETVFAIRHFGVLTPYLKNLFPTRILVIKKSDSTENLTTVPLIGMNPRWVHFSSRRIEGFKQDVVRILDIPPEEPSDKTLVLLIERLPPAGNYRKRANIKGGGAYRRSITNQDELYSCLASTLDSSFELRNIQLETLSLAEQIRYFSRARMVIAQHGAGLANALWMKPHSTVIELNHDRRRLNHFEILSRIKKHRYYFYRTDGLHATIDPAHLQTWLQRHLGNL